MGVQNFWNLFLGVSGSLINMGSFISELRAGKEVTGKTNFPGFKEALQIRNLSMQYENKHILQDINLQIHKNQTIALVGESGSGKTTLMNMMAGLLKPTSGEVLVDGVNLESIKKETFQQRIGYITQEPVIFNDTIFNNVTFWSEKNEANLKRFEAAVRKASIYEFAQLQPDKEDALLGNNGINLSGGQKQRLSIARELYKEVDFLFMDEATSALDSETERAIQENIEALKGQYSIIIIAHRLSTVKHADKIVLLNKGRIDQVGSFDELMQRAPAFKKMVELQGF
jgi:subfamily B ATP-binding cassette protein MsbA